MQHPRDHRLSGPVDMISGHDAAASNGHPLQRRSEPPPHGPHDAPGPAPAPVTGAASPPDPSDAAALFAALLGWGCGPSYFHCVSRAEGAEARTGQWSCCAAGDDRFDRAAALVRQHAAAGVPAAVSVLATGLRRGHDPENREGAAFRAGARDAVVAFAGAERWAEDDAGGRAEAEAGPGAVPDSGAVIGADAEGASATDAEGVTGADAGAVTAADAEGVTGADAGAVTAADAEGVTGADAGAVTAADAQGVTGSGTLSATYNYISGFLSSAFGARSSPTPAHDTNADADAPGPTPALAPSPAPAPAPAPAPPRSPRSPTSAAPCPTAGPLLRCTTLADTVPGPAAAASACDAAPPAHPLHRLHACLHYALRRANGQPLVPLRYAVRGPPRPPASPPAPRTAPPPDPSDCAWVSLPDDALLAPAPPEGSIGSGGQPRVGGPLADRDSGECDGRPGPAPRCSPADEGRAVGWGAGLDARQLLCLMLHCHEAVLQLPELQDSERLLLMGLRYLVATRCIEEVCAGVRARGCSEVNEFFVVVSDRTMSLFGGGCLPCNVGSPPRGVRHVALFRLV